MAPTFAVGDPIEVTDYGVVKQGRVVRVGAQVVFVLLDGSTRTRWFHAESLRPLTKK